MTNTSGRLLNPNNTKPHEDPSSSSSSSSSSSCFSSSFGTSFLGPWTSLNSSRSGEAASSSFACVMKALRPWSALSSGRRKGPLWPVHLLSWKRDKNALWLLRPYPPLGLLALFLALLALLSKVIPFFTCLAIGQGCISPRQLTFAEAVSNVGGEDKSIILVTVNSDYLDFLENWYESVRRLGHGGRVLFVAEDEASYAYLRRKRPLQTVYGPQVLDATPLEKTGGSSGYGSAYFYALINRRAAYYLALIDLNVTFVNSDVDMVWLSDPFPYFAGNYDLWFQEDSTSSDLAYERFPDDKPGAPVRSWQHFLCAGFVRVLPNPRSKRIVQRWVDSMNAVGKPVDDQVAWNKVIFETPPDQISIGVLPISKFPSGCMYFDDSLCHERWGRMLNRGFKEDWRSSVAVVHNNFVVGHEAKLLRFKKHNLWMVKDSDLPLPPTAKQPIKSETAALQANLVTITTAPPPSEPLLPPVTQ